MVPAHETPDSSDLNESALATSHIYRLQTLYAEVEQPTEVIDIEVEQAFKNFPHEENDTLHRDAVRFCRVAKGDREEIIVFSVALRRQNHSGVVDRLLKAGYELRDAGKMDIDFDAQGKISSLVVRGTAESMPEEMRTLDSTGTLEQRRLATVQRIQAISAQVGKPYVAVRSGSNTVTSR